ncbi:hypothetical protein KEM55_002620 [Ascosphaera atra]|nr:hypothetical protein KEM55_002620 [Ascosphaera atra]
MSSESQPITPEAFARALKELNPASIYGKVFEIRNSIAHLKRSNDEIKGFLNDEPGDKDLEEAVSENEGVIKRMEERVELCRAELEVRGEKWIDDLLKDEEAVVGVNGANAAATARSQVQASQNGVADAVGQVQRTEDQAVPNGEVAAAPQETRREGQHANEGPEEEGVYL